MTQYEELIEAVNMNKIGNDTYKVARTLRELEKTVYDAFKAGLLTSTAVDYISKSIKSFDGFQDEYTKVTK